MDERMIDLDWKKLQKEFAAPFDPTEVEFKAVSKEQNGKAYIVAYVDARVVAQRLDDVVGCGGWEFHWEAILTNDNGVVAVKGTLTVNGVSKSDVGDSDGRETSKTSVSDALKRCAVLFGIGRYLYALPSWFLPVRQVGGGITPTDDTIVYLRNQLAGKKSTPPATQNPPAPQPSSSSAPALDYEPGADDGYSADAAFEALTGANPPSPTPAQPGEAPTIVNGHLPSPTSNGDVVPNPSAAKGELGYFFKSDCNKCGQSIRMTIVGTKPDGKPQYKPFNKDGSPHIN